MVVKSFGQCGHIGKKECRGSEDGREEVRRSKADEGRSVDFLVETPSRRCKAGMETESSAVDTCTVILVLTGETDLELPDRSPIQARQDQIVVGSQVET